jgi:hypothetical protein
MIIAENFDDYVVAKTRDSEFMTSIVGRAFDYLPA